jgi:hypothetical protein
VALVLLTEGKCNVFKILPVSGCGSRIKSAFPAKLMIPKRPRGRGLAAKLGNSQKETSGLAAKSAHLANTEALARSTNFPITKAGSYRPTPLVTSCPDYADVTLVS